MADKSRRYRVLADEFKVDSVNRIKPGIAEATRAVLRRVPDHVFVRSIDDPDVALLVGLAREKGIVVTEMGNPRPVSGCNHYQEGTLMKNRLSPGIWEPRYTCLQHGKILLMPSCTGKSRVCALW